MKYFACVTIALLALSACGGDDTATATGDTTAAGGGGPAGSTSSTGSTGSTASSGSGGAGGAGPDFAWIAGGPTAMHTCVQLVGGEVKCWGSNDSGQLGLDTAPATNPSPVTIPVLAGVVQIAPGRKHSCAVLADSTVMCWGGNDSGQLGDGTTTARATPAPVPGLMGVDQIAVGLDHTCAVTAGGGVSCWGKNGVGQLGLGAADASPHPNPAPVTLSGSSGAAEVSLGVVNTCARMLDGTVQCWGSNVDGQLGIGTDDLLAHGTPGPVPGLAGVAQVAVGHSHVCARLDAGTVQCWGKNNHGQLGRGTVTDAEFTPAPVVTVTAEHIASGYFHVCAHSMAAVVCWGDPVGSLAPALDGMPRQVSGVASVAQIAVGAVHSCVRTQTGAVWCWGDNMLGQIDSSGSPKTTPTLIPF